MTRCRHCGGRIEKIMGFWCHVEGEKATCLTWAEPEEESNADKLEN